MKAIHVIIASFAIGLQAGAHARERAGEVDVTFVGDVMVAGTPGELIARGADPLGKVARLLDRGSLRIANLECVVATTGAALDKPFTFRADPITIPYLQRHFDALSVANNHSGDFGKDALAEQFRLLEAARLPYFGGGADLTAAHRPWIVERPGIAWSGEDEQVLRDIRAARDRYRADIVIPFLHWGWENEGQASERQKVFARRMIDAGASLVVGGHPHVTQGAESYRGRPIVYSLGNFLFNGFDTEETLTGWMLDVRLGKDGVKNWRTRVVRLNADGVPTPDFETASPCGDAASDEVRECSGK